MAGLTSMADRSGSCMLGHGILLGSINNSSVILNIRRWDWEEALTRRWGWGKSSSPCRVAKASVYRTRCPSHTWWEYISWLGAAEEASGMPQQDCIAEDSSSTLGWPRALWRIYDSKTNSINSNTVWEKQTAWGWYSYPSVQSPW